MNNKKAILEGIKDFLRLELISILPILIVGLETNTTKELIITQTLVAALKGVDKFLKKTERKTIPF